jgi:hypothetical protein
MQPAAAQAAIAQQQTIQQDANACVYVTATISSANHAIADTQAQADANGVPAEREAASNVGRANGDAAALSRPSIIRASDTCAIASCQLHTA